MNSMVIVSRYFMVEASDLCYRKMVVVDAIQCVSAPEATKSLLG